MSVLYNHMKIRPAKPVPNIITDNHNCIRSIGASFNSIFSLLNSRLYISLSFLYLIITIEIIDILIAIIKISLRTIPML